jgi:hypothetical protein
MAKRADNQKKGAGRQKARPKKVVKDLDAKKKSSHIKGGILAVLIGKSNYNKPL